MPLFHSQRIIAWLGHICKEPKLTPDDISTFNSDQVILSMAYPCCLNFSAVGSSLQHLIHHWPGWSGPSLALHGGRWCHVHPGLCRMHRSTEGKHLPAQVCTFGFEEGFLSNKKNKTIHFSFSSPIFYIFQFSVFLGIIFFLELTTGVLAFVFKDWIKDQLNLFINNNIRAYRDDIDLQNLIDFTQEYVSECLKKIFWFLSEIKDVNFKGFGLNLIFKSCFIFVF